MDEEPRAISLTRRNALKAGGAALAAGMSGPAFDLLIRQTADAQTPKRGGVFRLLYLVHQYVPGQLLNAAGVDDTKLTEMIRLQRRTADVTRRREILYDIQRSLSESVYYLLVGPSTRVVSAWEPYVRDFGPNLGNDYGGRLAAAWLDR